jgi:hypothetical protein
MTNHRGVTPCGRTCDQDIDQNIVDFDPHNGNTQKLRRRLLLQRFWQSVTG